MWTVDGIIKNCAQKIDSNMERHLVSNQMSQRSSSFSQPRPFRRLAIDCKHHAIFIFKVKWFTDSTFDQHPHQTVACDGNSSLMWGFSVPEECATFEKKWFFFHTHTHHDFQSIDAILPSVPRGYTLPVSFGGIIMVTMYDSVMRLVSVTAE